MTLELPEHAIAFLTRFFGPGNDLKWESIVSGAVGQNAIQFLFPWFNNIAQSNLPVVLPRRKGASTTWYAMASSPFQFRMLREDILGFVGPTYTNLTGRKAKLNGQDPIDAAVMDFFGQDVLTFEVIPCESDTKLKVWKTLNLMRATWEAKPAKGVGGARSTGAILRDFEMALLTGNNDSACHCLTELRINGHLSASNLLFLKVRHLASQSKWRELLNLKDFGTLLAIRRPVQITQELIRAVYVENLLAFETAGNPTGARSHFKDEILHKYRPLFRVLGAMRAPEVIKSFILLYASSPTDYAQPEKRDTLLAMYPVNAPDRPYTEQLAALIPESTLVVGKPFERALQSYQARDYDATYRHLQVCNPDQKSLQLLLVCTKEIDTLETVRTTIDFMNKVPAKEQEAVLESKVCREIWSWMQNCARSSQDVPTDWVSWLERLDNEGPWSSIMQDAEKGCLEWSIEDLRNDPDRLRSLSELLHQGWDENSQEELRNVLPLLIRFFLPEGQPDRAFRRLYQDLLFLLALDSRVGKDDLSAAYDIVAALLYLGLGDAEYKDLTELVCDLWSASESPHHLDWALDVLDLFTAYPCPTLGARDKFAANVLASLARHTRRTQPEHWDIAEALFQDLGQRKSVADLRPSSASSATVEQFIPRLNGKLVVLYTLDEAIGKRFRQLISKQFPEAHVELCHDKVASARLQHLAREADVFILNWRSAKHPATEAVTQVRGGKLGLIYPQGKGCGSILRAFYRHLDEQTL